MIFENPGGGNNMLLSNSHMFIKNNQFIGIMKSSIIKDLADIKLRFEFLKITTTDKSLILMIEKDCIEDHSNVNSLKLVNNEIIYSKNMNYIDCENFVKYLNFITTRNLQDDIKKGIVWIIEFRFTSDVNFFKIVLTSMQVYRLYKQIESFYSNYLILSSIMRQDLAEIKSVPEVKHEKKITEYIQQNNNIATPIVEDVKKFDEIDSIFELCLTSSLKTSLIHYTFNYFRYITKDHYSVLTNSSNQIQYTLPILIPGKFNIDENYFQSVILSHTSISSNNIIFIIKKILSNLIQDHKKYNEKPLLLIMISYLLFVYLLRYLYDSNKDSFTYYFKQFICVPNIQSQLIMKMIQGGFPDFNNKIFFKISDIDLLDFSENINREQIEKISKDYKHLIPISQKDFADKIFKKLENEQISPNPINFNLSRKKLIDISKLTFVNKRNSNSVLFDPDNTIDSSESNNENIREYNLLDYQLQKQTNNNATGNNNKITTKVYSILLNYIKNPSSLLIINDKDIPKEVLNLFEVISKKVLIADKITKDTISTLKYYNILLETLPNPHEFRHIIYLYIIFQIIIPYHNDIYNNTQFEDYLL